MQYLNKNSLFSMIFYPTELLKFRSRFEACMLTVKRHIQHIFIRLISFQIFVTLLKFTLEYKVL